MYKKSCGHVRDKPKENFIILKLSQGNSINITSIFQFFNIQYGLF